MNKLEDALAAFKNGQMIIVVDDADRENEGDLMVLAESVTSDQVAFIVRHSTGILCVALPQDRARALKLPLMVDQNQDTKKTAFTVTVDVKKDMTTGVSATERANTVQALANTTAVATDFIRPGHVFPVVAHPDGLAARRGHTEAGVVLAQLVGAKPFALLSEIVNDDGSMARGASLEKFAQDHKLLTISIDELATYAEQHLGDQIQLQSPVKFDWARLPMPTGQWNIATYSGLSQREQVVLAFGTPTAIPLIRLHSECFTSDVLHSMRCDCGQQLEKSIALIEQHGYGFIVYLRDHEGRGIGLTEKIKAYQLQDQGLDTVDANIKLGHEVDARDWSDAVSIIKALGLNEVILLSNNPHKVEALRAAGITCTRQSLEIDSNIHNEKYLATKQTKLGHIRGDK